jgi:Putative transposase
MSALRLVVGGGLGQGFSPARTTTPSAESDEPVAEALGVNVHAKQMVDGRDRKQLERIARYITRPPLAQDRFELRTDGRLELRLKNVWKDGTRAVLLEPDDLLVRLCAAVPAPRLHLLRYLSRQLEMEASKGAAHELAGSRLDNPQFTVGTGSFQAIGTGQICARTAHRSR